MKKEIKKILDEWKKCEAHECWENWQIKKVNQKYKQVINYIKELESPKWHKVADGDLPKKNSDYLCYCHYHGKDRNGEIIDGVCQEVVNYTKEYGFFTLTIHKVIAWCELPKYK